MRIENHGVVFEWAEVNRLLPETLAYNGYRLSELLGGNSYEVSVDDAKIVIETESTGSLRVRVISDKFDFCDSLSSVVAHCEEILAASKEAFRTLELTLQALDLLQPYIERVVRREIERLQLRK